MKKLLSIIFIGTIAFGCKNADQKMPLNGRIRCQSMK